MHDEIPSGETRVAIGATNVKRFRRGGLIALVIAIGIVGGGITVRAVRASDTKKWTNEQAIPTVTLIAPSNDKSHQHALTLPGRLQAYYEAPIFARVNGYLKRWNVDIGAHVHAGQVLAEIETPEIDEQLKQAKADLDSALSNQRLAEITAKRWHNLLASDSVSKQEADQKAADFDARQSEVAAAKANVSRIEALESFKEVRAPFDGIVTARETDIGALINAGSSSGAELFKVADTHKLRLYVPVPQIYAGKMKRGITATLSVPELPGRSFPAVLTQDSGAVSAQSGTLLTELEVNNKDGNLTPGDYAEVKFDLPASTSTMLVPASALITRHGGIQLALVDGKNHVVLRKVVPGLDFGNDIEVLSGLGPDDRIIDSPPDSLEQGDLVRVEKPTAVAAETNTAPQPEVKND